MLKERLAEQYAVFSISFEGIEDEVYTSADSFCRNFYSLLSDELLYQTVEGISNAVREECDRRSTGISSRPGMGGLSAFISQMCKEADRPVVLIIDQVDQACNHEIFLTFLGMLRKKYLARRNQPAFQSLILAGVYDVMSPNRRFDDLRTHQRASDNIKNMKLKIRQDVEPQYNSLWNIAADFTIDMRFSASDIAGMLTEYEQDVNVGMDISEISKLIYDYTSGYPFLVSRLCKILDEYVQGREGFPDLLSVWTNEGVVEAIKILLTESNTLFDDMVKKLNLLLFPSTNPELTS